ncbi:VOC family protein [Calycomorphotria hydatis]|uniref:Putative lyase n=1 Tax=Calycomorphotria hydatis TaxID=2528027 RepID=A0A517TCI5_9PLAN|nr:VOC family protein [Calycomorphotria hydatis]QDT66078.1 putative lyase [Calycomorphotria hydatis]
MQVRQIDHVSLVVQDLEASRHFYVDLLGMEEVARPNFDFPGKWFQAGETLIHLIGVHEQSPHAGINKGLEGKNSRCMHLAFSVEDARAAAEELEGTGVTFINRPKLRPDGACQTFVADPDGHIIELCSGG